jgi:uncharacterized membrane protein HdeD (DUF308 family)
MWARGQYTGKGSTGLYEVLTSGMSKRPLSVSIVGWILIVMGAFSLISAVYYLSRSGVSWYVVDGFVMLLVGTYILGGANWARLLYVGWFAFVVILTLIIHPSNAGLLRTVIFHSVMILFLFLPKANAYFSSP